MIQQELDAAHNAFGARDVREYNPLQMAYIGDTVHDLYVRSLLMAKGATVGKMRKQATRMVSAAAQAKHAAPKNADPADYAHATGLEALWGYLYLTGQTARLNTLVKLALERTEDIWQKQSSK